MFQTGQLVVYGGEGVCRVIDVGVPHLTGMDIQDAYYTLCPLGHKVMIYIPVDHAEHLRPIMTRQQAQGLIEKMPEIEPLPCVSSGPFVQRESYDEALHTHDCIGLVRILKTVYVKQHRNPGAQHALGRIDEEYRKRAEDILYSEFSAALDIPRDQIPSYIEKTVLQFEKERA